MEAVDIHLDCMPLYMILSAKVNMMRRLMRERAAKVAG